MRRHVAVLAATAVVLPLLATVPAAGQETPEHLTTEFLESIDDAVMSGSVTPPGAEVTDKERELAAYDNLVYGYPDLTEEEITSVYFKDESFTPPTDISREYSPRSDVRIVRDAQWNAPHIYGDTDLGAAFGAGYVAAEDRLPIMELLRALGRLEAFELLGDNASWLADAELARVYGYTEEEFQGMIDRIPAEYGQAGQDLVDLLTELTKGINHYIVQFQSGVIPVPASIADLGIEQSIAPWSTTDIVAVVSIVRALFGAGGGGELGAAARWLELVDTYGLEQAGVLYEDFRNRDNRDGPVHTLNSFPYLPVPDVDDPTTIQGNAFGYSSGDTGIEGLLDNVLDPGSIGLGAVAAKAASGQPGDLRQVIADLNGLAEQSRIKWEDVVVDLPNSGGRVDLSRADEAQMSNFIAAGAPWMESGTPFLIGGPQAGYFDPQILMDNELHGDRIHASGATFPGFGIVIVGRSADAAWSPTAGGSDMIDMYVEVLCDPSGAEADEQEVHYLHDGECVPMDRRIIREAPLVNPTFLPDVIVERSIHGPIVARGRIDGVAVAVSRKRSTYLKELDPGVSILKINRGEAETARDFVEIFRESHNLSTSWGYINDTELGFVHGGLYPIRPTELHPDFPVWGTGEYEWETDADGDELYLGVEEVPYETNPERDYIFSWNNHIAPDWNANDSRWGDSALYRADMLEDRLLAMEKGTVTPVDMVQLMEQAGLEDLRGSHVYPLALDVIERSGVTVEPREQQMIQLLRDWIATGALRRDGDQDGDYDHGTAVAIGDAWWDPIIDNVFNPALGQNVDNVTRQGRHNAPGAGGSAFQGGLYGQVWTDLASVLGLPVNSPTSQIFCGSDTLAVDGSLADCGQAVLDSLVAAGDALGGDDPSAWNADAEAERITFVPTAALSMHWVNRPTTQTLAQFSAEPSQDPAVTPEPPDPAPTGTAAPGAPAGGQPDRGPTPVTGGGFVVVALLSLLATFATVRRRRP